MNSLSAAIRIHVSKTFATDHVRFLSALTSAVHGPCGYTLQIYILFCGGTYSCAALNAIHLLSNWGPNRVLHSITGSYHPCHYQSWKFTSHWEEHNKMAVEQQILLKRCSSSLVYYLLLYYHPQCKKKTKQNLLMKAGVKECFSFNSFYQISVH